MYITVVFSMACKEAAILSLDCVSACGFVIFPDITTARRCEIKWDMRALTVFAIHFFTIRCC